MNNTNTLQKRRGVVPPNIYALSPRQERFIDRYFNADSTTFGNCYQSAIEAGYTVETSRNLTHNRPKWLSEKLGQMQSIEPEFLLLKLTDIMNDPKETTQNKLKAIDMLMKSKGVYQANQNIFQYNKVNIQGVLD